MFGFRKERKGILYGALIDIGSGTIGIGIVVSRQEDQEPTIIYAKRFKMRISEHTDEVIHIRRLREQLISTCLVLHDEGYRELRQHDEHAKIDALYVTCSSPWSFTLARNVHYEGEKQFEIDEKILTDLIRSAEDEILTHVRETPNLESNEFSIVESATVDMKVNDYPVKNALGLTGVSLSLSHIIGLIPNEILLSIHEVQDKLFPKSLLKAHTTMLVMYCVLRDLYPNIESLIIVDVTGEATEFGIVENNLLIENTWIPVGADSFVRKAALDLNRPIGDIESLCLAYVEDPKSVPQNFIKLVNGYLDTITKHIDMIRERHYVHRDIVVTAHEPLQPFFTMLIHKAAHDAVHGEIRTINIRPETIGLLVNGASNDVYLGVNARFFHKLHGCGE